jgi:hypothetical protein
VAPAVCRRQRPALQQRGRGGCLRVPQQRSQEPS